MVERRERRRRDGTVYSVWRARWRDETGAERSKTFDRAADARAWDAKVRVMKRAVEWGRVPSNAVKLTRKPPKQFRPAVQAIPPSVIEVMRARLLADGRLRDATLLVVLAYAGLRPQEALALEWRHVRERTLLVERAVSDGQLKVLKNRRQPRTIALLKPLPEDLAEWRRACGSALPTAPVFPAASWSFWRATDWRNWRKRIYKPVAESVGLAGARPYDLRHAFASLLIHEGRLSVVEIAAQLGHNPTVCLDTYAHVMAEERDGEHVSVEEQIVLARGRQEEPPDDQLLVPGFERGLPRGTAGRHPGRS